MAEPTLSEIGLDRLRKELAPVEGLGFLRQSLQPPPNVEVGQGPLSFFGRNTQTGEFSPQLSAPAREFLIGLVDLMEGPKTGNLTGPAALSTLGLMIPGIGMAPRGAVLGAMGARKGRKFMLGKPVKDKLNLFDPRSIQRKIVTTRSGTPKFEVSYVVDGDTLHINEFYPVKFKPGGLEAQKGEMGLKEVRSVMEDLFAKNPEVQTITGFRDTGARVGDFADKQTRSVATGDIPETGFQTGVWKRPRRMKVINVKGEVKVKLSKAEQEKEAMFAIARAVRSGDKISIGRSTREAAKKDRSLFGFDVTRPTGRPQETGYLTNKGEFISADKAPNIGLKLDMRKAENLLAEKLIVPKAFFKAGPISKKFEGVSPDTRLRDSQVIAILKEHNIRHWPFAGGGVEAVGRPGGRKTIDFDNPTLLQVTKWLDSQ